MMVLSVVLNTIPDHVRAESDIEIINANAKNTKNNIYKKNIYICSQFEGINKKYFSEYFKKYLPQIKMPKFTLSDFQYATSKDSLYLFVGKKNIDAKTAECLKQFPKQGIVDIAMERAARIGTKPDYYKILRYGKYYGPVNTSIGYEQPKDESSFIILFLTNIQEPENSSDVFVNTFGLKDDCCRDNPLQ